MFVQVKYQLRSRGRSVLVLCIAALLAACMAFYVGNIGVNKAALQSLSDSVPVTVRITSRNGAKTAGLNIEAKPFDHLTEAGVHDVRCTAVAAGAFSPEVRAQEMFLGGDTIVRAGNSLEALELSADNLHFADGQSASFLSGDSAQCVIGEDYAERTGLHPGDTLSLEIYTVRQSMNGTIYQMIGDAALEIIGTHSAPGGADVILPVNFLRTEAETAGVSFLYDSCSALVDDSTHLKDFKAEMQKYFMDINPSAEDPNAGDALSVEDELFVKTASRLRQNIALFQSMLVPFFALIIGLVVLTTFLTMRSTRRDMAIARSLGVSKWRCAAPNFISTVLLDMLGCAVILPILSAALHIPALSALVIFGLFTLCAALGTAAALLCLLRFDTLTLLTQVD
ncbi:ABC transporter permease [Hominenteromicrobium sp.]|uniref:ABC transporter permease n=1 Tax=Hominenteromicrobium sp. TaxID=3073581 RepID=UPI003AB48316